MSPYLDYEFVMVFKIRQDSYIYIYIYIYIILLFYNYCVTYLTILGKEKQKKTKSKCDDFFFDILPLKFANFFQKI
jgi:hypothetical protein